MCSKPYAPSIALVAVALATIAPAAAQQTTLPTLVVDAAGLAPFENKEIGRSYTVIDGARIGLRGTAYVADVLRQVPGIAVTSGGAQSGLTDVRVRGGEANHVLVLIDGVPITETWTGGVDFGRLQVTNVERIEVLRGPQSAFWGANAMSGVINIVTTSAREPGVHGSLAGETGTDGTKMTSGTLAYAQDNFRVSGGVALRHTDGFNISSLGNELDGASHIDANARFSADITPQLTLDGTIRYGRMTGESDDQDFLTGTVLDTNDTFRADELFGSLGLKWVSEDGIWFQNARVSGGTIERGSTNAFGDTVYAGDLYKASYQAGRHFDTPDLLDSTHTVTLGYDLVHETFQHFVPSVQDRQTRTAHSLVGEYRGTFADQFYLTAALRHDFNDKFADATTYSVSGAWQIPDTGTKLHASIGTGSTNPTMWEQFGYSPGSFTPNPNLTPETSFGWDVGVEQAFFDGVVVLDATYFNQTVENKIRDVFFPIVTAVNVPGSSPRQGVELSALLNVFEGFTAGVTYTYLDARDPTGALEVRRPQHSGAINLAYTLPEIPLTLHGEVLLRGETKDALSGKTFTLPAYTVVNAGVNYQVSDHVEVYGRVHNLFDTRYQEVQGYNTQGRTFYVGAKASF